MKQTTQEWLIRATEDLSAAQVLLSRPDLTNMVAFHAQQTVEKAFKAVRSKNLTRLRENT